MAHPSLAVRGVGPDKARPAEEPHSKPPIDGTYSPDGEGQNCTTADDPFGDTLFEGFDEEALGKAAHHQAKEEKASRATPIVGATPGDPLRPLDPSPLDRHSRPVFGSGVRRASKIGGDGAAPARSPGAQNFKDISLDPAWDDRLRPAGSGYSAEEWAQAREDGRFHVIEILSGEERGLLRFDARNESKSSGWSMTLGRAFDGCMLVGPGASPSHPNHMREKAVLVTDHGKKTHLFTYGIVEPGEMVNEWGRGACLTVTGSGLIDAPLYMETGVDGPVQPEDASRYPRDR